jgi:hypothetical protein
MNVPSTKSLESATKRICVCRWNSAADLPDSLPDRWKAAQNMRLAGFAHDREFAQ